MIFCSDVEVAANELGALADITDDTKSEIIQAVIETDDFIVSRLIEQLESADITLITPALRTVRPHTTTTSG